MAVRVLSIFLLLGAGAAKAALDPWLIQGEYLGRYGDAPGGKPILAAQVVALDSAGRYRLTFAQGGLPGEGWDKSTQKDMVATASGDKLVFSSGSLSLTMGGGDSMVVKNAQAATGLLRKVHRASPTYARKAPDRALILFDGSGTSAWRNARMSGGHLVAGPTTVRSFRSFNLHIEFLIPFAPAALYPSRGNSGVYLQGRFEAQIYDTFGWQPPYDPTWYRTQSIEPEGACGSVYAVSAPKVNAAYPPGSWQTFDIAFQAAQFDAAGKLAAPALLTLYQNGVLVQDQLALTAVTGGASLPMNDSPGPLSLQFHESDVLFRNIWIEENPKEPIAIRGVRSGSGSRRPAAGVSVDGRTIPRSRTHRFRF